MVYEWFLIVWDLRDGLRVVPDSVGSYRWFTSGS